MNVCRDIRATRLAVAAARRAGRRIGFVPTMGALHAGHRALVDAALRDGCFVVVSIFVNPTQFGPNEDYQSYPRTEPADLRACEQAGADLVFLPSVDEMYPPDTPSDPGRGLTAVHVAKLTETLCGPHRPGHFAGVATVVTKLFNIVQPDAAYFGQKDAQQLAVVRRLVADLNIPVQIVGCPTVREPDGLALSSRNIRLSRAERVQATCLYRALVAARDMIQEGQRDPDRVESRMRSVIEQAGPSRTDYASIVHTDTMQPVGRIEQPVLAAVAVWIGSTRLIDNLTVDPRV
jgi:pantoate--beta-alanine ligase